MFLFLTTWHYVKHLFFCYKYLSVLCYYCIILRLCYNSTYELQCHDSFLLRFIYMLFITFNVDPKPKKNDSNLLNFTSKAPSIYFDMICVNYSICLCCKIWIRTFYLSMMFISSDCSTCYKITYKSFGFVRNLFSNKIIYFTQFYNF